MEQNLAQMFDVDPVLVKKCIEETAENVGLSREDVLTVLYDHYHSEIEKLPLEIIDMILAQNLPVKSVLSFCAVNKKYAQVCNDNTFWKVMIRRDFNADPVTKNPKIEYKARALQKHKVKTIQKQLLQVLLNSKIEEPSIKDTESINKYLNQVYNIGSTKTEKESILSAFLKSLVKDIDVAIPVPSKIGNRRDFIRFFAEATPYHLLRDGVNIFYYENKHKGEEPNIKAYLGSLDYVSLF